jgi:hypothetical protein
MALVAEDVTFSIGEDVEFALPMIGSEALDSDITEWLAQAGLSEADIEADVGTWLANMGSGALNFGTAGASVGGPWGALIGGLLGAGLGAVQSATAPDKPPGGQPAPPQAAAPRPQSPPPASPPPPAEKPPLRTIQNQPDTATLLNALRDALPALTLIAQQMSRPRTESTEDAPAPEVAADWSLEQEWPYAQEGVSVASSEREAQAEDEPDETAETSGEQEDMPAEQLAPSGEAYAGAGLAKISEEDDDA